jgi:hypothetical protein
MKKHIIALVFGIVISSLSCKKDKTNTPTEIPKPIDIALAIAPQQYVQMLKKGMDVDWSKTGPGATNYNLQTVKDFKAKGLSHVRIRVVDAADNGLFADLDKQINDCIAQDLIPVLAYQANDFKNDPSSSSNLNDVVAWWGKVAEHYQDKSFKLSFDLIIEVSDALNDRQDKLDEVYEKAVTKIRETNPARIIFISPRVRSDPDNLKELKIPTKSNGFLMAEWHFYASGPSKTNANKLWTTGTAAEKKIIMDKINTAKAWEAQKGIKTWVGAWMPGDYNDGDNYSIKEQVTFANFVACQLDKANVPYAVNSDTKFYNRDNNTWISLRLPILEEIIKPTNCQ